MASKAPARNPLTREIYKKVRAGNGSAPEIALVKNALTDPASPLHQWMEGVPDWVKRQFAVRLEAPDFKAELTSSPTSIFDKAFDYALGKLDDNTFSAADMGNIFSTGIPDHIPKMTTLSPHHFNIISSAVRMNIRDLRPTLADKLTALSPQGWARTKKK